MPAPPPPSATGPSSSLFTHAAQPNIARNTPVVLSRSLVAQNAAQAAGALITLLSTTEGDNFSLHPTTPAERLQVIEGMRAVGTPAYFHAFTHDVRGREILASWLSDATPPRKPDVKDDSEVWSAVLYPLLQLLHQLPITLEHLKDHVGLGKLITGVQKRSRNEAARKLADTIKDKWSALVSARPSAAEVGAAKRPASSAPAEGVKRARSTTPTQPAPRSVPPPTAATTPRPPMPSAARPVSTPVGAARPAQTEPRVPVRTAAKPATIDPLASARHAVRGTAPGSASQDLAGFMSLIDQPPSARSLTPDTAQRAPQDTKKRKKSVHWKDYDGMPLVAVKLIEPAIYEEEGDLAPVRKIGALDMEEGGAFRQAHEEMDEQIDWYTPRELLVPDPEGGPLPERGIESQAKLAQEEREKALLLAVYMHPSEIPLSPEEPDEFILAFAAQMPEPQPMTTGFSGEPAPERTPPPAVETPAPNFAAMAAMMGQMAPNAPAMPVPPMPAMFQAMMQGAQSPSADGPPMPMPPWGGMPGMPFPFPPPEMMAQMGRGGTGHPPPEDRGYRSNDRPPRSEDRSYRAPRSSGRNRRSR